MSACSRQQEGGELLYLNTLLDVREDAVWFEIPDVLAQTIRGTWQG
jgi:hypothetical protein